MGLQEKVRDKIETLIDIKTAGKPWAVFNNGPRLEEECEFTHVSLFSGCGGFDLGLRQAGFKTIYANDLDFDACQTYRSILGDISNGDITQIKIPKIKGRPDVLTAGFPCQPFSNAGSRKGIADDRGNLFQTAIDIVKRLKPRTVIFENVRGILSFSDGKNLLIANICRQLDKIGYDVTFSLIDASLHHVPQKRLRVFIVGVERIKKNGFFTFPSPIFRSDLTLADTILNIHGPTVNQDELIQLNPQAITIGDMVPEGGSWKDIPYEKLPPRLQKIWDNIERYRWPKFYRRFHRNEIAGTITAAFKPENAGVWHPIEKRPLSVREIARIQSFPDWFEFTGRSIKSKYQQIGNAVPPRLAYEIANQLVKVLHGEDLRDKFRPILTFNQFVKAGKPLRARDRDIIFSVRADKNKLVKKNEHLFKG
jgi:DNA (cytosine-5)-methyltransferase 1